MTAATGRENKDPPPLYVRIAPEVERLASEGVGRNQIAVQLDVANATVSKAARHAGVDLDAAPAEATAGRARQAEHARLELAGLAHQIAMSAGTKLLTAIDRDDLEAMRPLAVAFGVAADKEIALARHLPVSADATGDSVLSQMGEWFAAAALDQAEEVIEHKEHEHDH